MKKRYLLVIFSLLFLGIVNVNALTIGDCEVLVSFKKDSSLDDTKYICKNKTFGKNTESIYYSGQGNTIVVKDFNAYYLTNYDQDVKLEINGKNSISLLHINKGKFNVVGKGVLKFKEDSFVKKVKNGESVYYVEYKNISIVDKEKKIFEGTKEEFQENYEELKTFNKLPEKYNEEDYNFVMVADYAKMTSVIITESWIKKHIDTSLNTSVEDGFGVIKYVTVKKEENKILEKDNVTLITDENVDKKYELNVDDLKDKDIALKVEDILQDLDLLSLYDLTVYNGKKEVVMKDGNYTIKIKLDSDVSLYEDLQIIYVNDKGDIEEYIDASVEGEYVIFNTSHLSHYGIIGKQAVISTENTTNESTNMVGHILKISLLVMLVLVFLGLILFIVIKGNLLSNKKKSKKLA